MYLGNKMRNKVSVTLCIIGGVLMMIAAVIGSTIVYEIIFGYLSKKQPGLSRTFSILLYAMAYIALGGGISVIIGSLITFKVLRPGKWIISIGAGMGLIAFISFLVMGIYAGTLVGSWSEIIIGLLTGPMSYGIVGVFMTIFARRAMTKGKGKKEIEEKEE